MLTAFLYLWTTEESWILVGSLQDQCAVLICVDSGFLSIDCGGSVGFTSAEGIVWRTDDKIKYQRSDGVAATIKNITSVPRELQTLRYFPAASSSHKSCYIVPVPVTELTYLVRLGFQYGNYDGFNKPPSFSVSLNGDIWALLKLQTGDDPLYLETTTFITSPSISLCLIRLTDSEAPFVNSIELRRLPDVGYVKPDGRRFTDEYHHLVLRINFGGPTIRYNSALCHRVMLPVKVPIDWTMPYVEMIALQVST